MKTLISNLRRRWLFFIPLFLLLILLFSMWDTNYYFGGDFIFPLKPQDNIQRAMTLWEEQDGGGRYFNYVLFLWEGFFYLLSLINIPSYISMKILIAVLYVLGFVCTYSLYLLLFKGTKYDNKLCAFLTAIIFTLNPAAVLIVVGTVPLYGFPICFFFLIKYLETKNILYSLPFAFFLNLSFFPDLPQAKLLIVFMVAVFLLLLLYRQLRKIKLRSLIFPLVSLMLITFFLNSFLLFPFLYDSLGKVGLYQQLTQNVIIYQANADIYSASLLYIPRFFNSNLIDKFSPLGHFLSNDFFDLWTFFLQFLAILSTFFVSKKKEKRIIYLLLASFLVFILMAKGINPPFGEVYRWMIYHVPIVKLFRTTATVIVGATVFYSILVAITVYYLSKKWKWFYIFFLMAHLVIFFPVYTGVKLVNGFELKFDQKGITLPSEYLRMGDLLNKGNKDGKVLILPPSDGYVGKIWGYDGQSLIRWLTDRPLFLSKNSKTEFLDTSSAGELCFFTSMNNISYFLREKDARGINVKKKIDYPGNKVVNNQYFSLQKTSDNCFLPHIYTAQKFLSYSGDTKFLGDLSHLPNYQKGLAIFHQENSLKKTEEEIKIEKQVLNTVDETIVEAVSYSEINLPRKSYLTLTLNYDHLIGDIIYPYVRVKPGSIFYPFILWKEENLLKSKKLNDRELLDQQLFLASKRIEEISRWGLKNQTWLGTQERFRQMMEKAIMTASSPSPKRDQLELVYEYIQGFRKTLQKKVKLLTLREKKKIDSWEKVFSYLEKETLKHYRPDDYSNFAYDLTMHKSGVFQGYLLFDKGRTVTDEKMKIFLELNGAQIASYSAEEFQGKNLLDLGRINLKNPENNLKIHLVDKTNLIDQLNWRPAIQRPSVKLNSTGIVFSPDSAVKTSAVKTGELSDSSVIYQEVKKWEPDSLYLLSLRHTEEKNATLHLQIKEKADVYDWASDAWVIKESNIFTDNLNSDGKKGDFKLLLTSDKNSAGVSFFVSGINGIVKVEDIRLEKVILPRLLFVDSRQPSNAFIDQTKVDFLKKSPTKYEVTLKDFKKPNYLVFSEGFDPMWKIYRNGKEIAQDNHYLVNGYANAWYLQETGDLNLTIEYWPQRFSFWGWVISLTTLGLLSVYAFFKLLKKGKNNVHKTN